jgi:hypothetical protein
MDQPAALAIFEDFLRKQEAKVGVRLAEAPGSSQRLSKGWAFYYQSLSFVTGGRLIDQLVGQGPIVISDDGRLLEGGSLDVDAEALLTTGKSFVARTREAEALQCRRCGSEVAWPDQLDDAGRAAIAVAARAARLPTIKRLQEQFGMSLGSAKALGFHISRSENTCHRCRKTVSEGVSTCPNCKCLNLNW